MSTLHQTRLDFQLERTSEPITSKSGLVVFHEAALALGVVKDIRANLPVPGSNRGIKPEYYVLPLVQMFCGGGQTLEDIRQIEADKALKDLCGYARLPGADAIGKWLKRPDRLKGMKRVNGQLAQTIIARSGKDDFTLDTDATFIETEKGPARITYQGFKGFSVLLSFLADLDLHVGGHYRNGNVPASTGIKAQIEHCYRMLKAQGKRLKYFRSDSAAYNAEVINTCADKRIAFTITADQDAAVKAAIADIPAHKWQRLCDEGGVRTDREYATTVHCMEQTKAAFTLIVQRWPNPQLNLFEDTPCCYYAIATNDTERETVDIIYFHNHRGNAENYNKEVKSGFRLDYAPTKELRADAVYFEIGMLAYNLTIAIKYLCLGEGWVRKTIATLRWELIFIAGKLVNHSRRLLLKVEARGYELLQRLRERIAQLVPA